MNYQIELHTVDYRGDHAADVVRAIAPRDNETVAELVARTIGHNGYVTAENEKLVIRVFAKEGM